MSTRRSFRHGTSWEYPDSGRSPRDYLRSASQRPGFWIGLVAALVLAVAGYKGLGVGLTIIIYLGGLLVIMTVGYYVWRKAGRAPDR